MYQQDRLLLQDRIKYNGVFEIWCIYMNCHSHIMSNIIKQQVPMSNCHQLAQLMNIQQRIGNEIPCIMNMQIAKHSDYGQDLALYMIIRYL